MAQQQGFSRAFQDCFEDESKKKADSRQEIMAGVSLLYQREKVLIHFCSRSSETKIGTL